MESSYCNLTLSIANSTLKNLISNIGDMIDSAS